MPSLEEEFNSLPYDELYDILRVLSSSKELSGKFIVAGGSVPYILSGKNSCREHGDIDIMVRKEDMPIIRKYLKNNDLYESKYDSLSYNGGKMDYGVTSRIKGLPVEFYPYEVVGDKTTGEFYLDAHTYGFGEGEDQIYLKENHIKGLSEDDFYTEIELDNGNKMKTISPEALIIMKLSIGKGRLREKDKVDLEALLGVSLDFDKLSRVYKAFNDEESQRTIVPQGLEKFSYEEIVEYFTPKVEKVTRNEIENN